MPSNSLAVQLLCLTLAVSCALGPRVVVAQPAQPVQEEESAQTEADYFMSLEHRQKIYQQKRKRPGRAVALSLLLPGLGNLYAEQFLVGGLAFIFLAFSAVFLSYGIVTSQPRILRTGLILGGGTYVGALTASLFGVSDYNRELRQGLKVGKADFREVWTPAVTFRF